MHSSSRIEPWGYSLQETLCRQDLADHATQQLHTNDTDAGSQRCNVVRRMCYILMLPAFRRPAVHRQLPTGFPLAVHGSGARRNSFTPKDVTFRTCSSEFYRKTHAVPMKFDMFANVPYPVMDSTSVATVGGTGGRPQHQDGHVHSGLWYTG